MMYAVMMMDEATFDDVTVATFETEAEAEAYMAELQADDVAEFGEILDEMWVVEVE